jgi:hypothetical protein
VEAFPILRLTWAEYRCGATCPPAGPGGRPFDGIEPVEGLAASAPTCDVEVRDIRPGEVVVLRVRGDTCTHEIVAAVPALTVPPEWTLRAPTDVRCTIPEGGSAEDAGRCLLDAAHAGLAAEWWTTDEDGRVLVWRVVGPRQLDLVRPAAGGAPWTVVHCSGAALVDVVPGPEADGCGPEGPMALDPP